MYSFISLFLIANAFFTAADYTPEALLDEVKNLPGAENLSLNFRQFSGYLPVTATKHLHYWFVESSRSPETDPIAFWTNGGPGCSGLLGFLTEQGPFRPNKDLSLSSNPYSWNTIANTVFIESPCGVGFSYSDDGTGDDYKTDDAQTAKDNYQLLQQFFNRFPQYRTNDLYVTSESYGGHYLPSLAKEIVDRNVEGNNPILNFKGFAVGNPATTFYSAIPAGLDTYWGHQLISKPLWDRYSSDCVNVHPKNVIIIIIIICIRLFQFATNLKNILSLCIVDIM
jgi:carboxypeptidase C (cathepsin A)